MGIFLPLALFLISWDQSETLNQEALLTPEQAEQFQRTCDTLEQAARKALGEALPLSKQFEFGGALLEKEGCFTFTPPQTSNNTHGLDIKMTKPAGYRLAGLYHTHPAGDGYIKQQSVSRDASDFSPHDLEVMRAFNVPSFMQMVGANSPRVLTPGRSASRRVAAN